MSQLLGDLWFDGLAIANRCGVRDRMRARAAECCPARFSIPTESECADCCCEPLRDNSTPWLPSPAIGAGDFLGFLVTSVATSEGYSLFGGSDQFAGLPRDGVLRITIEGILVATSCEGTSFGQSWLTELLARGCARGDCVGGSLTVATGCDTASRYVIPSVRLAEVTVGNSTASIADVPCCAGRPITIVLLADQPIGASLTRTLQLPPTATATNCQCFDWTACEDGNCPPSTRCGDTVRVPGSQIDFCDCEPLVGCRVCATVPVTAGLVTRAPIITITGPVGHARLTISRQLPGQPCGLRSPYTGVIPVAEVGVVGLPAGVTLVLDSAARTVTATNTSGPCDQTYLTAGWSLPLLPCGDAWCVCLTSDPLLGSGGLVSIETVEVVRL